MRFVLVALWALQMLGCASWRTDKDAAMTTAPIAETPWAKASLQQVEGKPWQHLPLPGKRATQFEPMLGNGRAAMAVAADASASMVRKEVRVPADALGQLSFSWKVQALIAGADMAARDADDAPVRLVLAFEGDRSRFSAKNAMLSELARALTGEEMPYATLMYVWCNTRAPGTVVLNPRTDRIRKIVVESGPGGLGVWRDYQRDVRADFIRAFGEEPGALVAVGIMTDSDNTGGNVRAWYGPLNLHQNMAAAP